MVEVPSAQAQCSAKIEVKHAEKTDALIAASDVAKTEINGGDVNKSGITVLESDSGVETSDDSSDDERIKSAYSKHSNRSNNVQQCDFPLPYAQRRAYTERPALKCFLCKRGGHIAKYCWAANNGIKRRSQYPKTTPRHYEVYSARWGSNPKYGGHSNQTHFPLKTQIRRLQTEDRQYGQQLRRVKMEMEMSTYSSQEENPWMSLVKS
ncbi:hypothetical protein AB205_0039880 [Aquarana catesbeiana]|uniref:CCHC-type domain-containing protein n=1 Tax=Aquarana catesbeiana TaxID=8400 RepID=A0A2G9Q435_AQUCT|nr:hypothetical protein AB205_0039880 [Aquarana catesbeiana]